MPPSPQGDGKNTDRNLSTLVEEKHLNTDYGGASPQGKAKKKVEISSLHFATVKMTEL
ncbi:MAG: hypothetical protein K2O31_03760 [Clostridia bacterium]|nr:hypothetical protein [Clostridia bacterium]